MKASPKLLAMKAMRRLSGEMSARSPKWVTSSMFFGQVVERAAGFPLAPCGGQDQEQGEENSH